MNQDNGGIIGKINTPTTSVASGVWSLQDQFESQSSSIWPLGFPQTTIANTCRFNDGSSDYLNLTLPNANGAVYKWTYSFWVKRCNLGSLQIMAGTRFSGNFTSQIKFDASDRLEVNDYRNSFLLQKVTNRVFRDTSAWYHIVVSNDNSVASPETEIYVNGVKETSFSTTNEYSQNDTNSFNNDYPNYIGQKGTGDYFDGYICEMIFIDGQALDQTSFGAFNPATNIWEPIPYAGTYGGNGFKLNFSDSSNLGDDTSGNGNDFTVNNLTSIDQSTDTPSNNFATLNNLDLQSGTKPIYELGNLAIAGATDGGVRWYGCSSIGFSTGKWYCEVKNLTTSNPSLSAGVSTDPSENARNNNAAGFRSTDIATENYSGNIVINNTNVSVGYGSTWTASGDICMLAVDIDNNKFYIGKNGTWADSDDPSSNTGGYSMSGVTNASGFFHFSFGSTNGTYMNQMQVNFGSPPYTISSGNADANGHGNFEYTVPTGFFALCTKNLSEHG
tara:strand:+ start:1243 stop:2745 length:1503 start_codon:yes stop_codon:yes gene_type:complete